MKPRCVKEDESGLPGVRNGFHSRKISIGRKLFAFAQDVGVLFALSGEGFTASGGALTIMKLSTMLLNIFYIKPKCNFSVSLLMSSII